MAIATTLRVANQWAPSLVTAPRAASLPRIAGSRQRRHGFIEDAGHAVRDGFEASVSLPTEPMTRSWRA